MPSSQLDRSGPNRSQPTGADFLRSRSIKRSLMRELEASHAQGTPLPPEAVLARWPTDPADDRDVASLLFEDYCRREHSGEAPSLTDYQQRFPSQRDSLLSQFRKHGVMRSLRLSGSEPAPLALPVVGDEVFGFRLRHELGAGAFATVFLAEQVELAGRPVVIKVSAAEGTEPQTLAQLQHTHIVPIYSQHENSAAGVRAVCMPFFGGASLSRVLGAVWIETSQPTNGRQLVQALRLVQAPSLADLDRPQEDRRLELAAIAPQTPLARLAQWTHIQASVWIVACLADGLHHAHQRGIMHRDIKPSNILLAADGQPLLLDFNLSEDIKDASACAAAALGGTVAYMAPEHLRAMAARDPALARKVDGRSDIYSLGMVLYELLVGHKPFDQSASYAPMPALIEAMAVERAGAIPSVRERRTDVPWAVESILRKCLHPDPDQRYQTASALAEDLRAFIEDCPLRHAPELSRAERLQKWTRRHPRLTTTALVGGIATAALILLAGGLALAWTRWAETQDQLASAESREQLQQFDENAVRALSLISTTTDLEGYDHQGRGLDLCRRNLGLYHVLDRDDWQQLPGWKRLDEARRERLLENVRELLLLYAWGQARADGWRRESVQQSLLLVDNAERIVGLAPTAALWEDRAFYLEKLGRDDEAAVARAAANATTPNTARDYYLLAATRIRTDGPTSPKALAALDRALALNPRHYWALMQRGECRLEQGELLLAIGDFSEAIRVQADLPFGYFNRGYVFFRAKKYEAAVADFTRAVDRDPDFVLAWLNRGLVNLELKQFAAALGDFDRVLALGRDDAVSHGGRGRALESLGRTDDADAAFALAQTRLDRVEPTIRLRFLWVYGFAIAARRPAAAAAAFDAVLAVDPRQPQALYGRAMLAVEGDRLDEAIGYFQRALEADPYYLQARRYRAIVLARVGHLAQASQDINACLAQEPNSGAVLYAAACVAALASDQTDPVHAADVTRQALALLEKAFRHGYGQDCAAQDRDLRALWDLPAFQQLLARNMDP
jgi:serine/threonine protein kinase/Tfp pilus assembly protein PilF